MDTDQIRAFRRVVDREIERLYADLDREIHRCGITDEQAVEVLTKMGGFDLGDGFENWLAGE